MLNIFSCVYRPSVCLFWITVYLGLLPIFWSGVFVVVIEMYEPFVYFGNCLCQLHILLTFAKSIPKRINFTICIFFFNWRKRHRKTFAILKSKSVYSNMRKVTWSWTVVHSFNKCTLSTYSMPETVLHVGDVVGNRPHGAYSLVERISIK